MDSKLLCRWTKRGWELDGAPCADVNAAFAARPFLQELTVFDCGDAAPAEACMDLAAALPQLQGLASLVLNLTGIGEAAAQAFAAALPRLQGLTSLDLFLRGSSEDALQAFAAALPRLQGLASLVLGLHRIGEAGAQAFAAALPRLQGLASLDLCLRRVGEAALQAFAAALPTLQHLTDLKVIHVLPKISSKVHSGYRALGNAATQLKLTSLDCEGLEEFFEEASRLASIRRLLLDDDAWGVTLQRLAERTADKELAGLLQCIGGSERSVGLNSSCEELRRQLSEYGVASGVPLRQALGICVLEKLKRCLPATYDREVKARRLIDQCREDPVRLLPAMWSRLQQEMGSTPVPHPSRAQRIRPLLLVDDTWDATLQRLAAEEADEELAGLLQCIGGSEGGVGLKELRRQLSESGVASGVPLCQALVICSLEKLKRCLPPTFDREVKARRLIDQCQEDPVRLLPAMWARLQRELGSTPVPHQVRAQRTVLVITPGFALQSRPEQFQHLTRGGWQVRTCQAPDPQGPGFNMGSAIVLVEKDIAAHRPDVILAASRGGAYLLTLWERGCTLPSIMINVHPHCSKLPENACTILCHGSRDGTFRRTRKDLEALMQSGSPEHHFLYYTEDSGQIQRGGYLRNGDEHKMQSLLQHDTLNRLVEAAVAAANAESPCPPDQYLLETWKGFLSAERREAEKLLGHSPADLLKLWDVQSGHDNASLLEVEAQSREFEAVRAIFLSESPAGRHYGSRDVPGRWRATQVLRVQRVQNGMHQEGLQARHDAFRHSIRSQGLDFKADVHTRWLFHGPGSMESLESIVHDMYGFNPLLSGSAVGLLWGAGIYFARDAQYAAKPPYVVQKQTGEKQVLLCLVETGIPCLASPSHIGSGLLLPYRKQKHRFHSTVDSLSNPEVWIIQQGTQALPAYVITFA